jgi:hypothetical protein
MSGIQTESYLLMVSGLIRIPHIHYWMLAISYQKTGGIFFAKLLNNA